MRIGSFFLILLVALVALGFLFSDSLHLRKDLSNHQKEIERLTQALQTSDQQKQDALNALQTVEQQKQDALNALQTVEQQKQQAVTNLQTVSQQLQSCQQQVAHFSEEQAANRANGSAQPLNQTTQSSVFNLVTFLALGVGAAVTIGWKGLQKHSGPNGHSARTGKYIYVTDAELKELVQRRRNTTKRNTPRE